MARANVTYTIFSSDPRAVSWLCRKDASFVSLSLHFCFVVAAADSIRISHLLEISSWTQVQRQVQVFGRENAFISEAMVDGLYSR